MRLSAHGWRLELRPDLGGSVAALAHDGRAILRPAPSGFTDPLQGACFPLVPYANRIANGRFAIDGVAHRLPLNFGDHPHSLHGIGWQAAWDVVEQGPDRAVLAQEHDGGAGWPWRYQARQTIRLAPRRATFVLALTNRGETPMPSGLGFHPYLPRDATTTLTVHADRVWLSDDDMLPTAPAAPDHFGDWSRGAAVEGDGLIDNAFEGWNGEARVDHDGRSVAIEAHGAPVFHLYRPVGCAYFCIEPVSHLPDAINNGGMTMVAPGETTTLEMHFVV